ncbi:MULTISPECIES: hypothetical protein [unclassified Bradyrhizobium]|uniref:hypothetical protein n=1 Tax=unclassified Bradyrhizobium TaxID=2631580 RepID=UPI0028EC7082|nr:MULTISPECIES: hypothetical protein [unclassified Bradyrhizobium]
MRSDFRRSALTEQLDHQALTAQRRNQLVAKSDEHRHKGRMAPQVHRMIVKQDSAIVGAPGHHGITVRLRD